MQHGDLDKTKVLKTQRDSMIDVRKPNSESVLKSVILVLNTGQTSWTYPREVWSTGLVRSLYQLPESFVEHVRYWTRLVQPTI
jgi:hypothetical protein